MSKIKEPNYFSRVVVPDDHPLRPIRDTEKYLQLFAGATSERVVGEASPTYLADPEAPRLIRDVAPDCRVLISLRDPVERAFSHYLMMRNNGKAEGSFLDEVRRGLRASIAAGCRPVASRCRSLSCAGQEISGNVRLRAGKSYPVRGVHVGQQRHVRADIWSFSGIRHDLSGV